MAHACPSLGQEAGNPMEQLCTLHKLNVYRVLPTPFIGGAQPLGTLVPTHSIPCSEFKWWRSKEKIWKSLVYRTHR